MTAAYYAYYESPIGVLEIAGTTTALTAVHFVDTIPAHYETHPLTQATREQLDAYFRHRRETFDLPLEPEGTSFQRRVWQELLTVPYGRLLTYQDVADALGNPKATRAVGAANGQNPIPIIIPCHRIVGSGGKLTGYGGGLWRKEWLLRHEGALLV